MEQEPALHLKQAVLDTPLGPMVVVADETALRLLEFIDSSRLEKHRARIRSLLKSEIPEGDSVPIRSVADELDRYFSGTLRVFKTPLRREGSPFRQAVWEELQKIPFGETRSYSDIAVSVGNKTAVRAVAQANGENPFALIIPCHRVIRANGQLCGYAGGISRKRALLLHEKEYR